MFIDRQRVFPKLRRSDICHISLLRSLINIPLLRSFRETECSML
jgi:hypothetical protein